MKVLNDHAVIPLFEKAKSLEETDHHAWRCIYIQLRGQHNHMRTQSINTTVGDLLEGAEGYIYFCADGDVFILFEGALRPVLARLGTHFADLDPNTFWKRPTEGLFTVFDLSKHFQAFLDLCETKYVQTIAMPESLRPGTT